MYTVGFTNACGTVYDSVFVDVIVVDAQAGNDTIICPGDTAFVWASGGVDYSWKPSAYTFNPGVANTFVYPPTASIFTVEVTDINGCVDTANVFINHYPTPEVLTNEDQYGFIGDAFDLIATGNSAGGSYQWTPAETVDCPTCPTTVAHPENSTTYIVLFTDENGCQDDAAINIYFDPIVYVPNTFTPDNDAHNNFFKVEASNITDFELLIFNRWGELIYKMTDPSDTWDGTYKGVLCKDGTYVWKMTYKSIKGDKTVQTGHINILK
nr:gliding motility-associated C-terminal domain-containing protein [Lishizhenia tianjinensis]